MPKITHNSFKKIIWDFYKKEGRVFPWRQTTQPYKILVSEIMLQQTQTYRVEPKYLSWLKKFPSFKALGDATRTEVLKEWQGLGYNRRAIALHEIAKRVVSEYGNKLPQDPAILITLPGIGPNTAGSILAFAYNLPTIFIETNIRTVFIHFFFNDKKSIDDKEIIKLVEKTLDKETPREWYYALMDYGVMLKKTIGNLSTKSATYRKQSTFKGSNRELRSHILKVILKETLTEKEIIKLLEAEPLKIKTNLLALHKEGFIKKLGSFYTIK